MSDPSPSAEPRSPAIILVEPQLGENIGAAARAMANFGLTELRLVAPRSGWPNSKAVAMASGAFGQLEEPRVFATTDEAVADLRFVLATTARNRGLPKAVIGPREAVEDLRRRCHAAHATGVLFGRERWGLTNAEIALADAIVTFPVNAQFASLNIAQAVLLVSYEWMQSGLDGSLPTRSAILPLDLTPAPKAELLGLSAHLVAALEPTGYFRSPTKRPTMVHNLQAILQRASFTEGEIRVLRGVVSALDRSRSREQPESTDEADGG